MRSWFERMDPHAPNRRGVTAALVVLAALFVGFFALTVRLEAFKHPGKGDLDVFLRAAWAAREGQSLYQITDDHGFHYLYPPLFACLSIPLADPPHDASPAQA